MRLPIILDCDPGDDDTVAILMALSSSQIDLIGITTVAGNATVEKTFENARDICSLAGHGHIPVYKGCARPLIRPPLFADYIHGSSGIDGAVLPVSKAERQTDHAVDFMAEAIRKAPNKITLAATAALTNIALFLTKHPELHEKIEQIVWLGGSNGTGNITLAAEFNAYSDPHALQIVLNTRVPFYIIPLDISHQVCTNPDFMERLREKNTVLSTAVMQMLAHTEAYDKEYNNLPGRAIHDACVIAFLIEPQFFEFERVTVAVYANEGPFVGATAFSTLKPHLDKYNNAHLACKVKGPLVLKMIEEAVCSFNDRDMGRLTF